MDHRFLRDEAARFRAMADDTDREATKLRLLKMAAAYEARAKVAASFPPPNSAAPNGDEPNLTEIDGPERQMAEPIMEKAPKVELARKSARRLKETVLVERQPTLRRGSSSN